MQVSIHRRRIDIPFLADENEIRKKHEIEFCEHENVNTHTRTRAHTPISVK